MSKSASEAAVGSAKEEEDLLRWGWAELTASYQEYHSNGAEGQEALGQRRLQSLAKEARTRPLAPKLRKQAETDLPSLASASDTQQTPPAAKPGREQKTNGKATKTSMPKRQAKVMEAPRGPVPAPFGAHAATVSSSAQVAAGPPAEISEESGDPKEWGAYYAECAKYYADCAQQCGVQPQSQALAAGTVPGPGLLPGQQFSHVQGQLQAQLPTQTQTQAHVQAQALAQMQRNIAEAAALQAQAQALLMGQPLAGNPCHSTAISPASPWPGLTAMPNLLGHPGALGCVGASHLASTPGSLQTGVQTTGSQAGMLEGVDEGLANLLMAWYYSGYYTGRFAARQEFGRG